jgi:ADP-ribose pyrophosphatase YjhB (NUDIX family)
MIYPEKRSTGESDYRHTVDIVVFRFCKMKRVIEVLLVEQDRQQGHVKWALPGIPLNFNKEDLSLKHVVNRLVKSDQIGFPLNHVEQLGTVGDDQRDPRCWSSSTFYLGVVSDVIELKPNQLFLPIDLALTQNAALQFDHKELIEKAYGRLVSKSLYSSLPLLFLGDEFSTSAVIEVHTILLSRKVLKSTIVQRLNKLLEADFIRMTGRKSEQYLTKPASTFEIQRSGAIFYFDRCLS